MDKRKQRAKTEQYPQRLCRSERLAQDDTSAPLGVTYKDETIDWGDFETIVCVNTDPNFGG